MIDPASTGDPLVTLLGRLLESRLGSLEHLLATIRTDAGDRSMEARTALSRLLGEPATPEIAPDPLHGALLAAVPGATAAVSGVALHLRDLLAEGMALPETTSMMRKRGVPDLADRLVPSDDLLPGRLPTTIATMRERAEARGAKHVLIFTPDGVVHVAGRTPEETMAHWSNVEFAARAAVMRVEERLLAIRPAG